jgi:long-chain acyl-CoA synthetase
MSANQGAAGQTLNDLFDTSVSQYGSNIATHYLPSTRWGGRLTYYRLAGHVERFADALYLLDVRKDDRVALALPSSPQYIIAFFAALRLGAVVANCEPAASAAELSTQLAACGAETIVVINDCWPRLQEIRPATALKWAIVADPDDTLPRPVRWLARDELRRSGGWIDVRREERLGGLTGHPRTPKQGASWRSRRRSSRSGAISRRQWWMLPSRSRPLASESRKS